jgi:nicotinate-nucleotide pyrophosphorylase (carboxylating)
MSVVNPPLAAVRDAVSRALAEDLGALGDLTAALVPEGRTVRAAFVARDEGVVAGGSCVLETFAQIDPAVKVNWLMDDGTEVDGGETLGRVDGPLASILTAERTSLNFLCHLSGIATLTRRFVRSTHGRSRIWDTRKTTPGLRALEKAAVRAGGGVNHRGSLSDFVLVKDNHLGGLSIAEAVRRAAMRWPGRTIEVECETLAQVDEALDAGASLIMLDNMPPDTVAEAVAQIGGRATVEVSGGVTLETVGAYAAAGADLISIGMITNSAPNLDIGLDLDNGEADG